MYKFCLPISVKAEIFLYLPLYSSNTELNLNPLSIRNKNSKSTDIFCSFLFRCGFVLFDISARNHICTRMINVAVCLRVPWRNVQPKVWNQARICARVFPSVSRVCARSQPKLMYRIFRYVSLSSGFNYKNRASLEHLPPLMPSPARVRPLIVVNWSPAYEPVKARQHWLISSHCWKTLRGRASCVLAICCQIYYSAGR